MNNRGAMGGTNVPAGAPPAAGPGAMIPDGAMGMVMYLQHCLSSYSLPVPFLSEGCFAFNVKGCGIKVRTCLP